MATSALIFSFSDNKGDDKKKKYQIIHQVSGETTTYDTILPMSSPFTPEDFLKEKGISDKNVEIIMLPSLSESEKEGKEMKTIVREMRIVDDEDGSAKEEVEIKVEIDEKGNMTTKKMVNGVEVEMTEEDMKMIKSHQESDEKVNHIDFDDEKIGKKEERVEIKVEIDDTGNKTIKKIVNGEEVDMTEEELENMKIMEFNDGENMQILIDSELTKEMEKELEKLEIEMDNTNGEEDKEVKIITKKIELHTDGEGKDLDWESKDGEKRVMIMSSGDKEDLTLVLVTENYDEANEGKTKMIFEHKTKEMNLHPNPNDGVFMIRFESDENAKTTITVTDANGKKVLEEKLGKFSGKYEKEVDLKQYGSGIYTITIQSGDNVNVQKVMIK